MPGQTTVEKKKPGAEINEHTEGIGLFSTDGTCYGQSLRALIEDLKPRLTEYGDTIQAAPHADCLDVVVDCTPDETRRLLERSIWLIECDCILDRDYFIHLQYLVRTSFPYSANGVIWVDETQHSLTEDEKDEIDSFSTKTKVVYSKQSLLDKLEDYLEFYNPYFTSANLVAWRNEVHDAQKRLDQ